MHILILCDFSTSKGAKTSEVSSADLGELPPTPAGFTPPTGSMPQFQVAISGRYSIILTIGTAVLRFQTAMYSENVSCLFNRKRLAPMSKSGMLPRSGLRKRSKSK